MNITTYQSDKAWPDKRWLASLDLGKGLLMSFFAPTEEAAIAKAKVWHDNEKSRQARIDKSNEDKLKIHTELASEQGGTPSGRGSHLVGKVWMIHVHTREKVLINQVDQTLYEGRGYVKGGARSK